MRFDLDMPIKAIVSRERVGFGGASVDEVEQVGGMVPLCDERPVIFDMVQALPRSSFSARATTSSAACARNWAIVAICC
jgi:hypothetical protein